MIQIIISIPSIHHSVRTPTHAGNGSRDNHTRKNIKMSKDNHISEEISPEVKAQVLGKLQEVMELLPFLVNLSDGEKKGIATIGTERGAMDETFSAEMGAHPELVPAYVDAAELARDRKLRADLLEILQRTREVCDVLEDTAHVAGSDVLLGYLAFYSNVKQAAARGVTGAATLLANLGRFFPRRGKQGDAPPAPGA